MHFIPSSRPSKVLFRRELRDNNTFCIIKDQLSSSPLDFGSEAKQQDSFWIHEQGNQLLSTSINPNII